MRPGAPPDEASLQELIAKFPEVISGGGEPLLLIRREQSVPDTLDGMARWSLDHLFVTRSAVPVLVEVKRASDTRIRREVVGQLLDYAANGVAYWQAGTLAEAFASQCANDAIDPALMLSAFLAGADAQAFWEQVDANLSAGRIRMIVAADEIPKELARIIEFLNEQMRCTVLAIELQYFVSDDGRRTLAPKVIGETERSETQKSSGRRRLDPISIEDWIATHLAPLGEKVWACSMTFLEMMRDMGAQTTVASSQGSIVCFWTSDDGARVYPFFLNTNGRVSVGFGWIASRPGLLDDAIRKRLLDQLGAAIGGLSTSNIKGHPSFPVERLQDPVMLDRFRLTAKELVDLANKADDDGSLSGWQF